MNVTSKLDLDGMLNDWPAPALDEAAWETRAARIVEVALSRQSEARQSEARQSEARQSEARQSEARQSEDTAAQTALLAAPDLAAEPGEEQAGDILREVHAAGEGSTMADGSQADRAAKSEASLSGGSASRPPERKRQSLKEIAERASQAPGRLSGAPGANGSATATPLPRGPLSTPLPPSGRGSMPPGRVSTPPGRGSLSGSTRASSPSLRTGEGVTEDSGVIDLNRLSASVPPEQVEAAGGAQPGAAESLEDEKPAEVAAMSARKPRAVAAPAAEVAAKKRSGGMIAGVAIAALGLAAAVAVMVKTPKAPSQQETAAAPAAAPAPAAPRDERPTEPAAPVAAAPAAPAVSAEAEQQPAETAEKLAAAPRTAAAPAGAGAPAPAAPAAPVAAQKAEPQGKVAAAPTAPGKPGDLPSAMQAAVGDEAEKQSSVVSEAPVPASGPLRQQNVPEQPSQGSVQAALGSVMGNARACVAGADDVSRAQITFSSTGQVSKVSVSGWAAANGQSGCVQSALKAANVGPFSKPSFSVNASIRP
ncbi:hypothetical protein WME99_36215 [Sorangium sp. So ce136]|uniref:hypothetical protein n=1 Tax=Sorangium sp. So ce136 TaxID=3133284 RepID=UPI003EFCC3BF